MQNSAGEDVVNFPETHRHQHVAVVSAHFRQAHHQWSDLHLENHTLEHPNINTCFSPGKTTHGQPPQIPNLYRSVSKNSIAMPCWMGPVPILDGEKSLLLLVKNHHLRCEKMAFKNLLVKSFFCLNQNHVK
jgi:hypothetical protein